MKPAPTMQAGWKIQTWMQSYKWGWAWQYTMTPPELSKPLDILAQCTELMPTDRAYIEHGIIQRFGSAEQPIHIDDSIVTINGVSYDSPIVLPITMGSLSLFNVLCDARQQTAEVISRWTS